jgi:DnaJ-class molecular chaperone
VTAPDRHVVALSGGKDARAPRRMQRCLDCEGTGTTWLMPDGHLVECSGCKGWGVVRQRRATASRLPSAPGARR